MDRIKKIIIIKTTQQDEYDILKKICEQLVGNEDYINCNIVVNSSADRQDGTVDEVHVIFYEECVNIPNIII